MPVPKPKVLVVDDEPGILSVLVRQLGNAYTVRTALSGALGLEALAQATDTAIILSDMQMPEMNGSAFLARARTIAPNAVRLLLTGLRAAWKGLGWQPSARRLRFRTLDQELPLQLDGEVIMLPADTPVTIELIPGALATVR